MTSLELSFFMEVSPLVFTLSDFILWFYIKTPACFCHHKIPLNIESGNQHMGQWATAVWRSTGKGVWGPMAKGPPHNKA